MAGISMEYHSLSELSLFLEGSSGIGNNGSSLELTKSIYIKCIKNKNHTNKLMTREMR